MNNQSLKQKAQERFWSKVKKTSSCWLWRGGTSGTGYGGFYLDGQTRRAHRIAYLMEKGDIPTGKLVLHKCDVRLCVRPSHLTLGTQAENLREMVSRGRSNIGEKNPRARLTKTEVLSIVKKWRQGMTYAAIAELFDISKHGVRLICRGQRWSSVTRLRSLTQDKTK